MVLTDCAISLNQLKERSRLSSHGFSRGFPSLKFFMNTNEEILDDKIIKQKYDFSKGIRGKHYKEYRKGHSVHIHKDNGTISIQYFTQEDGAIMLDPDIKIYFPNSESVNKALRSLITQN